MNKSIHIPEPCHENWNHMSPTEKGRFCMSCSKEVVDFTTKTKQEIIETIEQASGNTCGHFYANQLSSCPEPEEKTYRFFNWNKFSSITASVITFIMVFFQFGKSSKAQMVGKIAYTGDVLFEEDKNTTPVITHDTIVSGKLTVNGGNSPISGLTVTVKSGDQIVGKDVSNEDGKYSITLDPLLLTSRNITVTTQGGIWENKIIDNIALDREKITLDMSLDYGIMMLGAVVSIPQKTVETIEVPTEVKQEKPIKICQIEPDETQIIKGLSIITEEPAEEVLVNPIVNAEKAFEDSVITGEYDQNLIDGSVLIVETQQEEIVEDTDYVDPVTEDVPLKTIDVQEIIDHGKVDAENSDTNTIEKLDHNISIIEHSVEVTEDVLVEKSTEEEENENKSINSDPIIPEDETPELLQNALRVFPNPTTDYAVLQLEKSDQYQIMIYDNSGRLVQSSEFVGSRKRIDVTMLPPGTYLVNVISKTSSYRLTKPLVCQ